MKSTLAIVFSACALFAQRPAFEVASVKPSDPQPMGTLSVGMSVDAGRIKYSSVNLRDLVARAYQVKLVQVSGPSWIDSERYDITAKIPEGVARDQVPAMLRTLLEDRFKLASHRETKELPVYELVVAKGGPRMDESKTQGGNRPSVSMDTRGDGMMRATISSATMSGFSDILGRWLDRPVINKTGLEPAYDLNMEMAAGDLAGLRGGAVVQGPGAGGGGAGGPAPESAPTGSLFSAIQKLGLKLEGKRAPVDLLIVDSAVKTPTEN
jgi:uncharacterized protein (TIGR03435 family)